ncbi:CCDC152 [Branchiostoma lanceolatum]|uniref:CCDC152 protein n=1 Tax=Branchiostoma lanceolatum TaxID=7740 RepID=A0A8K0E7L0_BRALA|nr:CCDC152 [Branchiostoma lanceolatum]
MVSPGGLKQVDLDELALNFTAWQKATTKVAQENSTLQVQVRGLTKQLQASQDNERIRRDEISVLQGLVDKLQGTVAKRCDLEDENMQLKDKISSLLAEMDNLKQEHAKELSDASRSLQSVKEEHREQLKQFKDNTAKLKREEGALLQQTVQQKNSELQQLQKQLEDLEREKHSQIVQLKMAYDTKLLKLQKQTAALQQQQRGPSSANHEIFRQKLQALKNQSEQEKSALKRNIIELQQKLNAAQHSHGLKRRKL